jgi:cell wall-associated NlpC family hydrolase
MTARKRTGLIFSVLLITAVQMLSTSCSKRFFRVSSSKAPQVMPHQNLADKGEIKYDEDRVSIQTGKDYKTAKSKEQRKSDDFMSNDSTFTVNKFTAYQSCGDEIIGTAMKYIGIPYCMGGLGKKCIDCSGFVMRVFEEFGVNLPHNAQAISQYGTIIKNKNELVKGDVVFFKGSYKTDKYITHAGIYDGNNMFVHASSVYGVTITSMDASWWKKRFVFATRILQ